MAYDAILNGAQRSRSTAATTPLLQRQRRDVRLELDVLAERPRAARAAALGLEHAGACPGQHGEGSARDDGRPGHPGDAQEGHLVDDLWLIAARSGAGTRTVTFKGLPHWVHRGGVYTENRTVIASAGSFHDRFARWDVHVYHFVEPLILRKVAPTKGAVGSRVTLRGKGLAAATSVSFGGINANFRIVDDGKLVGDRSQAGQERADRGHLRPQAGHVETSFRVVRSG